MADFEHPPVELSIELLPTPERAFAQRAYRLLQSYSLLSQEVVFDRTVPIAASTRVDMPVAENAASYIAMRLVGVPVFEIQPEESESPPAESRLRQSSQFLVIDLQCGELDDEDSDFIDAVEDDDFSWRGYVAVIIDPQKPYNPTILDSQTGEELSGVDFMQASNILEHVCSELESDTLDSAAHALRHADEHKDKLGYGTFAAENYMVTYPCGMCGTENIPCAHNPGTLN